MRDYRFSFLIFIISFLLLFISVSSNGYGDQKVGIVTSIKGKVEVLRQGKTWMPLSINSAIYEKDIIHTMKNSGVQILFNDESIINIGENSKMEITKHIYNPKEGKRVSVFNLFIGRARALIGKKFNPKKSSFKLKTPTAVIGIRGTHFIVHVVNEELTLVITVDGEVEVRNILETLICKIALKGGFGTEVRAGICPSSPMAVEEHELQMEIEKTRLPRALIKEKRGKGAKEAGKRVKKEEELKVPGGPEMPLAPPIPQQPPGMPPLPEPPKPPHK